MKAFGLSTQGSPKPYRRPTHNDFIRMIEERRIAAAQKQEETVSVIVSPKARPIAEMFDREERNTRQPFMMQSQVLVEQHDDKGGFNLPLRYKLALEHHERERQVSKSVNLSEEQRVTDADLASDRSIVDLHGDRSVILRSNREIRIAPLCRDVYHYDMTQRDSWAQMEADLFLPTSKVDQKAELLTRDMRRYQKFVTQQLEQSYDLIILLQNYKLQLASRVQLAGQTFIPRVYHNARKLLLVGSEKNEASHQPSLSRNPTQRMKGKAFADSSALTALHNEAIFSDAFHAQMPVQFQVLQEDDGQADYDLVFE